MQIQTQSTPNKLAAHFIYMGDGSFMKKAYVDLKHHELYPHPLGNEIASTIFYNGIIMTIAPDKTFHEKEVLSQLMHEQDQSPDKTVFELLKCIDPYLTTNPSGQVWLLECSLVEQRITAGSTLTKLV